MTKPLVVPASVFANTRDLAGFLYLTRTCAKVSSHVDLGARCLPFGRYRCVPHSRTHTPSLSLCSARLMSHSFLSSCRASDVTHWTTCPISYHFSHPPELSSHHRSFRCLYIKSAQIDPTIHPNHILFIKRQCRPTVYFSSVI